MGPEKSSSFLNRLVTGITSTFQNIAGRGTQPNPAASTAATDALAALPGSNYSAAPLTQGTITYASDELRPDYLKDLDDCYYICTGRVAVNEENGTFIGYKYQLKLRFQDKEGYSSNEARKAARAKAFPAVPASISQLRGTFYAIKDLPDNNYIVYNIDCFGFTLKDDNLFANDVLSIPDLELFNHYCKKFNQRNLQPINLNLIQVSGPLTPSAYLKLISEGHLPVAKTDETVHDMTTHVLNGVLRELNDPRGEAKNKLIEYIQYRIEVIAYARKYNVVDPKTIDFLEYVLSAGLDNSLTGGSYNLFRKDLDVYLLDNDPLISDNEWHKNIKKENPNTKFLPIDEANQLWATLIEAYKASKKT